MSETTDRTSCISHRALAHYFIMYEDFLEVAKVSEHQYKLAAFWRVLETKTNDRITYNEGAKEKGQPVLDLWIEIPYSEFVNRSLGVYKESSFQVAAAESERLGFSKSRVGKRPRNPLDPNSPKDDFKEYLLLTGTLQKTINTGEYPTPIEINSPLLKSISARKEAKKQKKAIENNRGGIEINSPPVEINTSAIEINRNNNITESSNISKIKDTGDDVAFAPHHDTPASLSQEPSTTKETAHGTDQPTYLAGDHRANDNDRATLHPLSNLQGAVRDPFGIETDQHQGESSRTGTHTGQLADSSTVSDIPASSDAVTLETPLPSQANNDMGKNLPSQKTLSDTYASMPLSQMEVTTQNEVVQASNGQSPIAAVATRNLDEEHAALLRLGENATTGDGDTPTESGAQEETPTRRTRKPVEKKDEPTKAQIDAVYVVFDELFRETLETPDPDFSCTRTKTSTENIKELIRRKATPARLRAVFKNMWDEQNEDGDYWWRKRGRMTIKAVCNGYSSRVISLESPKVRATKGVSIQQQLQDKVPDFPVLSQVELMRMQPAQRKEYSQQFDAYLKAQREREERIQSEQQHIVQQASA